MKLKRAIAAVFLGAVFAVTALGLAQESDFGNTNSTTPTNSDLVAKHDHGPENLH